VKRFTLLHKGDKLIYKILLILITYILTHTVCCTRIYYFFLIQNKNYIKCLPSFFSNIYMYKKKKLHLYPQDNVKRSWSFLKVIEAWFQKVKMLLCHWLLHLFLLSAICSTLRNFFLSIFSHNFKNTHIKKKWKQTTFSHFWKLFFCLIYIYNKYSIMYILLKLQCF
jgi:hypothetical protein